MYDKVNNLKASISLKFMICDFSYLHVINNTTQAIKEHAEKKEMKMKTEQDSYFFYGIDEM